MKILVIGSGGREHALAWKLAQSSRVTQVFVAPGNGGIALESCIKNVPISNIDEVLEWAKANQIALTVVGPEAPLAQGVVDIFRASGLRIFGPTQKAAQLESSKAFSKDFMTRHGIPTANYATFEDPIKAHEYVNKVGVPIVIKADGLAAGKGVVVAMREDEAHAAIDDMLSSNTFGVVYNQGQARVVIEEFLDGEEASFMVVAKGDDVCPLATSQDHKRLLDGDEGPNTGGMGAYSPALVVTPDVHAKVMREIILPTLKGMAKDGIPYTGFLYAGLMITKDGGVKALEFNCRMGDPETQPILMRLKSDLFELLMLATDMASPLLLSDYELTWSRKTAVGVVLAALGYPTSPRRGDGVEMNVTENEDLKVFHSGTVLNDGKLETSGGRVLCVTALADNLRIAHKMINDAITGIQFSGMQYRRDIGHRALKSKEQ